MAARPTRHLDLGCGDCPRNPYCFDDLHGIDIAPRGNSHPGQVRQANLAVEPIPFGDRHFDGVSAYDFLEHVPRVLPTTDGLSTRLPFVELMNEISRVLVPGGRLHAVTPCYPAAEAFQDPTHVNIITDRTHLYFTGDAPMARMYGFIGHFRALRVEWVVFHDALEPARSPTLRQRWRRLNYRRKGHLSHLLWEFESTSV
jgi:SAM-dependent methyltransferase